MNRKRSIRRRKYVRPWTKKCKDLCRQFIAFMFSNVGIIGLVVSYTIAGAFIFQKIEQNYHLVMKLEVNASRNEIIERIWNKTLELNPFEMREYKNVVSIHLLEYEKDFVNFIRRGYEGEDDEDYAKKWSFAGAFLYSLTVITTIGYGNISPHTIEGKITTIVYAIIGMPLFLLYLSNIGDIMARSFKWVYANLCLCRGCPGVARRREERKLQRALEDVVVDEDDDDDTSEKDGIELTEQRFNNQRNSIVSEISQNVSDGLTDETYDVQTVTVPVTICLGIMVGYICGGALLFCNWEDWEFLDASYFCFISLSTIGFGDLVPGDKIYGRSRPEGENFIEEVLELSFVFCSMYLMLGMALIAMCFNLMQEEVINKIRTIIRTIKHIFQCNR